MDYRDYDTRLAAYAVIRDDAGRVLLASVSYTHLRAHETVLDLVCRRP